MAINFQTVPVDDTTAHERLLLIGKLTNCRKKLVQRSVEVVDSRGDYLYHGWLSYDQETQKFYVTRKGYQNVYVYINYKGSYEKRPYEQKEVLPNGHFAKEFGTQWKHHEPACQKNCRINQKTPAHPMSDSL